MDETVRSEPRPTEVGELGIPVDKVGTVAQALGAQARDRGEVSEALIVSYLLGPSFDEGEIWDRLGPEIDKIEQGASLASPLVTIEGGRVLEDDGRGTRTDLTDQTRRVALALSASGHDVLGRAGQDIANEFGWFDDQDSGQDDGMETHPGINA